MKPRLLTCLLVTSLAISVSTQGYGDTVTSPVVGFTARTVNPGDDSVLKIGFQNSPIFSGRLSVAPLDLGNNKLLTLNGEPLAGVNSLPGTHYLKAIDGPDAGATFEIMSNRSDEVTVAAGALPFDLSNGDRVAIIPRWTLGTLIPPADQPASQKAAGDFPPDRRLELYLYTPVEGIGFSPSRIFFLTETGWRESTRGFPVENDFPVAEGSVMWIRSRAGGNPWRLVTSGTVNSANAVTLLQTRSDGPQDNVVGLNRPVPVALNDLGLNDESVFRSSSSTAPEDRLDELHILDNTSPGANRVPSVVYFRVAGEWRSGEPGFPESGDVLIDADAGLIVRKAPTANGAPVVWVNQPTYP